MDPTVAVTSIDLKSINNAQSTEAGVRRLPKHASEVAFLHAQSLHQRQLSRYQSSSHALLPHWAVGNGAGGKASVPRLSSTSANSLGPPLQPKPEPEQSGTNADVRGPALGRGKSAGSRERSV